MEGGGGQKTEFQKAQEGQHAGNHRKGGEVDEKNVLAAAVNQKGGRPEGRTTQAEDWGSKAEQSDGECLW